MKKHITYLEKLNACFEAIEWAEQFETMQKAWDNCEQGDWMLWLLGKQINTVKSRKKLVLTACTCARLSLKYVPKDEKRPLKAIETAEKWARNDKTVSLEDVRKTANIANAIANATYVAYAAVHAVANAANAANAAAYVAYAAYAANAAAYVAYAVDAAAVDAANANATYTARTKTLKKCADIVRKDYPKIKST